MPANPDLARRFISNLSHTKGKWAGKPFNILPWEDDLISRLFALRPDGRRRIRRAYVQTARKSGKSEIGAAIALTLLVCDMEPGGEVVGAAAKRDQARLILDTAKRMVKYGRINGVPLSNYLTVRRDGIYFDELDAKYYIVSADGEREHGLNPHAIVFDEVHSLGDKRDLWDALETAQGAREDPLIVSFTTPGPIPRGVAYDEYVYAQKVLRGVINDPEFLPIIYEADRDLAIDDPKAWAQANPSYPDTPSHDWLEKKAAAVLAGRAPEYVFRRLQLSQWTTALERWLPRKQYEACGRPAVIPDGAKVWIGVDAALRRDSFGIAIVYLEDEFVENSEGLLVPTPVAHVAVRAFVPAEDGEYIDQEEVRTFLMGLASRYNVETIAYDPAYMTLFAQQCADAGLPMEPFPQSPERMSVATENFQRMILQTRVRHGNERTFDEQIANLGVVSTDRGVRISKRKSGGRIDAITAFVMALQAAVGGEGDDPQDDFAEIM